MKCMGDFETRGFGAPASKRMDSKKEPSIKYRDEALVSKIVKAISDLEITLKNNTALLNKQRPHGPGKLINSERAKLEKVINYNKMDIAARKKDLEKQMALPRKS